EHAIGAARFRGHAVKFRVVFPEFETTLWFEDFFDHFDDLAGRYKTGISYIVDAKRRPALPEIEAGADEIAPVRNRIQVVIDLWIALDFGEVIAGVIEFIERNA